MIPYWEPPSIHLFGLEVAGFGLMVGLGLIVGITLSRRQVASHGYDPEPFWEVLILIVLCVVVGGHVGHILMYEPEQLVGEGERFTAMFSAFASGEMPEELPNLLRMRDGLSSFGGFISVAILGTAWVKWRKVPLFPYLDASGYGLLAAWILARLGCFITHDHPGTETEFVLGVLGTCPTDATLACHPLGLYEALWALVMLVVMTVLLRKDRHPGFVFGVILLTYGPARLLLDVFRHPSGDTRYLGLTPAQYGSIVVFLVGLAMMVKLRGRSPMRGDWSPETAAKT